MHDTPRHYDEILQSELLKHSVFESLLAAVDKVKDALTLYAMTTGKRNIIAEITEAIEQLCEENESLTMAELVDIAWEPECVPAFVYADDQWWQLSSDSVKMKNHPLVYEVW